jgi:plasmid stability protein
MGDLLIRDVDPDLKRQLSTSAHRNGRSLSAEAAIRLKQSLADNAKPKQPAGQRLRAIIDGFALTDEERETIAESRHEPDRSPPSFGSTE